jgi:hypothetical protein
LGVDGLCGAARDCRLGLEEFDEIVRDIAGEPLPGENVLGKKKPRPIVIAQTGRASGSHSAPS